MLGMAIRKNETGSTDHPFLLLQEKVDRTACSNPDLHLNRATVRPVGWWSSASHLGDI